jgi:beta-galactosidase
MLLLNVPHQLFGQSVISPRERLSMNDDWSFKFGKPGDLGENRYLNKANLGFKGVSGNVTLPHDWAAPLLMDTVAGYKLNAFKPLGFNFPNTSTGWYGRVFYIPQSDSCKRFWIEFDGVFRESQFWVNNHYLGRHEGGYDGFRFDVTDLIDPGKSNNISVRIDASQHEGWWYEGAGIYRNVWMVKTDVLAIAPDGVFVCTQFKDNIPQDKAIVKVETKVENHSDPACPFTVKQIIVDAGGKTVGEVKVDESMQADGDKMVNQELTVSKPTLWSCESPVMYTLITQIYSNGKLRDEVKTPFGFRTIQFDADKGFLLNGKLCELKGVCLHNDYPVVGTAMNRSLQVYRINELKKLGCNAIRMSHNPADPMFMDLCDEMGMLVMAETRPFGSVPYAIDQLERFVCRDRNHPSVFIWSIGNEENGDQNKPVGKRMAHTAVQLVHKLDPTRLTTMANNASHIFEGLNSEVDVHGWNYGSIEQWVEYKKLHPQQPTIITEYYSGRGTRGVYYLDRSIGTNKSNGYFNSYKTVPAWTFVKKYPWVSGMFLWTGFDYGGEPDAKVPHNSFGLLDRCGFPKDIAYYFASFWKEQPVVHLLPHWNWPGSKGQLIDVVGYTNAEEAELFLNGVSLGKKTNPVADKLSNVLTWKVPYEVGKLVLKAFRNGLLIGEDVIETTGAPVAVQMTVVNQNLKADGDAIALVNIAIVDDKGRVVPSSDNLVSIEIKGEGKILGMANGDPAYALSEQVTQMKVFNGLAQVLIRTSKTPGQILLKCTSNKLKSVEMNFITHLSVNIPKLPN